jgi:hypothetical protein
LFCNIESAHAVDYPFSVTTSSISSGGTFQFSLSAQGNFYVDCGTGGTLSSDDSTANRMISGGTIKKTDKTNYTFKCTYSSAGTKTIRFGGTATNYNTDTYTAAISFYPNYSAANSAALITSISGNLSTIFPIYDVTTYGKYPTFYGTFHGGTGLISIPGTLFSGYTSAGGNMFNGTFSGCSSITSIPNELFSNITTIYGFETFNSTFAGTGITSLPTHLFSNITTMIDAGRPFGWTFSECPNLRGYVPPTLFAGLIANGSPKVYHTMEAAFGCGSIDTSCPSGTVQYITGYESDWCGGESVSCLESISLNWYDGNTQLSGGASSCTLGGTFVPPTPPARIGYDFTGWKSHVGECGIWRLDPSTQARGATYEGYTVLSGGAGSNESNYGLTTGSGQWATEFGYGTVWGMANCNNTNGTFNTAGTPTLASSGKNCWCQVTGFTASGNSYTSGPQCTTRASNTWVLYGDIGLTDCPDRCARYCEIFFRTTPSFRTVLFGAVGQ